MLDSVRFHGKHTSGLDHPGKLFGYQNQCLRTFGYRHHTPSASTLQHIRHHTSHSDIFTSPNTNQIQHFRHSLFLHFTLHNIYMAYTSNHFRWARPPSHDFANFNAYIQYDHIEHVPPQILQKNPHTRYHISRSHEFPYSYSYSFSFSYISYRFSLYLLSRKNIRIGVPTHIQAYIRTWSERSSQMYI